MQVKFSQKLIDETIKCFKEENGVDLSSEQANEILKHLSGLFLAYKKGKVGDFRMPLFRGQTETPTFEFNDLLSHSLNTTEKK